METAIAVFTRKSAKEIIESGGSAAWVLNEDHAARQRYLVCCRNSQSAEIGADEPHRAAFLVGVIGGFRPVGESSMWGQPRYRICMTQCARVLYPNAWRNWRNPVRYTSLEDLGIDVDALEFTRLDDALAATARAQLAQKDVRKLTIAEAKAGLAASFDVSPEAIEITIRG